MSEDRSEGTDLTLTPSQVIGGPHKSGSLAEGKRALGTGKLPARYTLGAQLGAGGMGEVLLATDNQIERDVAIKRLANEPTPTAVARFMREAKIQGRLQHPSIVPVHELAQDDEGRPFFVMKRLTGRTLAEMLKAGVSRQKLLRAFADVCRAVEFAHSRGVIHRDLKPANIMLGDFGEVYVLDWGVAQLEGDPDEPGAILGTPGYISPELVSGQRVDATCDVYALGCILFEILSGEPLVPRNSSPLKILTEKVDARPSQRNVRERIEPELDALCVEATAQDRSTRPTARQVADRVERYLDGDRDLALRRSLADSHLAAARTALDAGDDEASRARAMREAGRAIALDPRGDEATALVGRMMLEPPKRVPQEVRVRLSTIEEAAALAKLRMIVLVLTSWYVLVPVALFVGIKSAAPLVVVMVVTTINLAFTYYFGYVRKQATVGVTYVTAFSFAVQIGILARLYCPFLLAPAIAALSTMMFVFDPRLRWPLISLVFGASCVVPWLLEFVGILPRTIFAASGDLIMRSDVANLVLPETELSLVLYVVMLVGVSGFIARKIAESQRESVRSVELQAWHLRQLVSS